MYLLMIAAIILFGFLIYRTFILCHPFPVLSNNHQQIVQFEAIVPLAEEEEEIRLELAADFEREWEQYKPVLIEQADTVLLLEAEKLVSEVEAIVATKVAVQDKLQQLMPGFALLFKTKYYEPINEFIFLTLQRECNIELTAKELASFWN